MWDFVREDLIDEYHVTLTPRLIGGTEAPTLVDGEGFDPSEVVNLTLKSCRKAGDELYLVYGKPGGGVKQDSIRIQANRRIRRATRTCRGNIFGEGLP